MPKEEARARNPRPGNRLPASAWSLDRGCHRCRPCAGCPAGRPFVAAPPRGGHGQDHQPDGKARPKALRKRPCPPAQCRTHAGLRPTRRHFRGSLGGAYLRGLHQPGPGLRAAVPHVLPGPCLPRALPPEHARSQGAGRKGPAGRTGNGRTHRGTRRRCPRRDWRDQGRRGNRCRKRERRRDRTAVLAGDWRRAPGFGLQGSKHAR